MLTKIDHLGIAVTSLSEAISYYERTFGLKCSHIEEVPSQKVRMAIFKIGEVALELLESTSPDGPIAKHIERRGPGVHHIAFYTDNIEKQLLDAKEAGCLLVHETPIEGACRKEIAFLHPKSTQGVLTELCAYKMERNE